MGLKLLDSEFHNFSIFAIMDAQSEKRFYHTHNRGVEKRDIFLDEKDYFRGIHDLDEFNDSDSTLNFNYYQLF